MRSYLKLYGPGLSKVFPILEHITKEFNEITGMHQMRDTKSAKLKSGSFVLGHYDFAFEWHEEPSLERIVTLIETLDKRLKDTGTRYEITTLELGDEEEKMVDSDYSVSYVKFTGPGIYYALAAMKNVDHFLINSHGLAQGHYDYYFAWGCVPTNEQIMELISSIETAINSIIDYKVLYNITTIDSLQAKKKMKLDAKKILINKDKNIYDRARLTLKVS